MDVIQKLEELFNHMTAKSFSLIMMDNIVKLGNDLDDCIIIPMDLYKKATSCLVIAKQEVDVRIFRYYMPVFKLVFLKATDLDSAMQHIYEHEHFKNTADKIPALRDQYPANNFDKESTELIKKILNNTDERQLGKLIREFAFYITIAPKPIINLFMMNAAYANNQTALEMAVKVLRQLPVFFTLRVPHVYFPQKNELIIIANFRHLICTALRGSRKLKDISYMATELTCTQLSAEDKSEEESSAFDPNELISDLIVDLIERLNDSNINVMLEMLHTILPSKDEHKLWRIIWKKTDPANPFESGTVDPQKMHNALYDLFKRDMPFKPIKSIVQACDELYNRLKNDEFPMTEYEDDIFNGFIKEQEEKERAEKEEKDRIEREEIERQNKEREEKERMEREEAERKVKEREEKQRMEREEAERKVKEQEEKKRIQIEEAERIQKAKIEERQREEKDRKEHEEKDRTDEQEKKEPIEREKKKERKSTERVNKQRDGKGGQRKNKSQSSQDKESTNLAPSIVENQVKSIEEETTTKEKDPVVTANKEDEPIDKQQAEIEENKIEEEVEPNLQKGNDEVVGEHKKDNANIEQEKENGKKSSDLPLASQIGIQDDDSLVESDTDTPSLKSNLDPNAPRFSPPFQLSASNQQQAISERKSTFGQVPRMLRNFGGGGGGNHPRQFANRQNQQQPQVPSDHQNQRYYAQGYNANQRYSNRPQGPNRQPRPQPLDRQPRPQPLVGMDLIPNQPNIIGDGNSNWHKPSGRSTGTGGFAGRGGGGPKFQVDRQRYFTAPSHGSYFGSNPDARYRPNSQAGGQTD